VTFLVRFSGIFLNILLFVFLAVQLGNSQSTGTAVSNKPVENGKAASTGKADAKAGKKAAAN